MHLIKADHSRKLQLEGVTDLVFRPVDIDRAQTGFELLRSLRVYRFKAGSVIDGHAEDDEVLIVVLEGSVQLAMSERYIQEGTPQFSLSAITDTKGDPCVAYLPPNGAYRLVPSSDAVVAYARATTASGHAPKVFFAHTPTDGADSGILFEETTYPEYLRLQVAQVASFRDSSAVMLVGESESSCEALVHVRTDPACGAMTIKRPGLEPIAVESWDTVAVQPGERPTLCVTEASSALLMTVLASSLAPKQA